jgi:hypothetical protein
LDAPNKPTKLLHRKIELGEALLPARVPRNPRVTRTSKKWRGKSNRLGGSVDLGLLPQIPKGLQVLVARMGDLVILSFATMDEREWKPQSSPEVEDNYLYPSRISSCWGRLTAESLNYKGWTLWPIRTGVSGSQVKILGVSGWSPQRLRTDARGLHHSGEKQVWEADFFRRIKVSGLFRPESPPRKSPTARFLESSLQQIAKGCKCFIPK